MNLAKVSLLFLKSVTILGLLDHHFLFFFAIFGFDLQQNSNQRESIQVDNILAILKSDSRDKYRKKNKKHKHNHKHSTDKKTSSDCDMNLDDTDQTVKSNIDELP